MTLQERCKYYNHMLDSNEDNILQNYLNQFESSRMFKLIFYVSDSYKSRKGNTILEEIHTKLVIKDRNRFKGDYLLPEFSEEFWDMVKSYRKLLDRNLKLSKI